MGQCDSCMTHGKTRRLELGGNSGMSLCDSCLQKEVRWRRMRNKSIKKAGGKPFRTKYKY